MIKCHRGICYCWFTLSAQLHISQYLYPPCLCGSKGKYRHPPKGPQRCHISTVTHPSPLVIYCSLSEAAAVISLAALHHGAS